MKEIHSSGVKIQINSLEALERLMGGNTELEMELRQSVASSFLKKHFKGLINQDEIVEFRKIAIAEMCEMLRDEIGYDKSGRKWGGRKNPMWDDVIKEFFDEIKKRAPLILGSIIDEMIKSKFESMKETLEDYIEKRVGFFVETIISKIINDDVMKQLTQAINRREEGGKHA